jgi:hypothetical protein
MQIIFPTPRGPRTACPKSATPAPMLPMKKRVSRETLPSLSRVDSTMPIMLMAFTALRGTPDGSRRIR